MMDIPNCCPECGADWSDGQTCIDHFHLMGFWELDHRLYDVHHLMVTCYYLQHPSLYSPEGLLHAKHLLVQFVEVGISPQQMRKKIGQAVDSGNRSYKIKATPDSQGVYDHPIQWAMTAADVTAAGMEHYYAQVRAWADSVLKALRESGNLAF
jgi:hypothetical protein